MMEKKQVRAQSIAFVILAAGESRRMGRMKQLMLWKDKPLLKHLIDKSIRTEATDTFVVLGANAGELANTMKDDPVHKIYNDKWQSGIGSSIAEAATYILKHHDSCSGILISLVDQPLISTRHFNNLIKRFVSGEKGIVASSHHNNLGVPVIFGRKYFDSLALLENTQGAKNIIYANKNDADSIPCDDNYLDLDTPEDYIHFLKEYS